MKRLASPATRAISRPTYQDERLVGLELELKVPSVSNRRVNYHQAIADKGRQQDATRAALDELLERPPLPVLVILTRVSARRLDDDNLAGAFKAIRDTVARWIHGLEERVPRLVDGRPVLTAKGVAMTRPHAPDGEADGITWLYAQRSSSTGHQAAAITFHLPTPTQD
jgi:hypothetical protein